MSLPGATTILGQRGSSPVDSLCSVYFRAHVPGIGLGIEVAQAYAGLNLIYVIINNNICLIKDCLDSSHSCSKENV